MNRTRASLILLSAALLAATMPTPVGGAVASACPPGQEDYAAREAQSRDLEQFTGGFHEVVIFLVVVAVVVWVVLTIWEHEHPHHNGPAPAPESRS